MLAKLMDLIGYRIEATDGAIGDVHDFLIDEETWMIRYLIADTRHWLPGKRVWIAPETFGDLDWALKQFPVKLTKDQVRQSPEIDDDLPVSRQWESELHMHYGWMPYWDIGSAGVSSMSMLRSLPQSNFPPPSSTRERGTPHLRSIRQMCGYQIAASDGVVGQVADLVAETDPWKLLYFVIDTRRWLQRSDVLLPVGWMIKVSWAESHAETDFLRQRIKDSPEIEPAGFITREYEDALYAYYAREPYWTV